MPCSLHTQSNGLGYSMNSSGNYSSSAPPCTCPNGGPSVASATATAHAMAVGAWVNTNETSARTSYGTGSGAPGNFGWGPVGAGAGPPPVTNSSTNVAVSAPLQQGRAAHPSEEWLINTMESPLTSSNPGPSPHARAAHPSEEWIIRESSFAAQPSVRRTRTEHNGMNWPSSEDHLESTREQARLSLRELLYTLQAEMAAEEQRHIELEEQIEATVRLLSALN